jgi:hypothetical protein
MSSTENCSDQCIAQQVQQVQYEGQSAQIHDGRTVTVRRVVEVDWVSSFVLSLILSLILSYLANLLLWRLR